MTEISTPLVQFDELANTLLPLGTLNSPSELQGLLCGKLCGGVQLSEINWLLDAVEFLDFTQAPDEAVRDLLSRLFQATRAQLQDGFGLQLMLPDDDSDIAERVAALSQWCHGFLTGFGSAGAKTDLSEEARDALQDLAALVQVSVEDDDDESEADYMEVIEYVRIAAVALHLEFAAVEPAESDDASAPTLH
jgi:yecA family protein